MTISKDTIIKKITADNIIGVINEFNTRVVDKAHSNVQYTNSKYPFFKGSAAYGTLNPVTGWTNPQALPDGQLSDNSKTTMTDISDNIITASSLWNSMLNITRTLVKIRKFTSNWYHKTNSTNNLINTVSGFATFNTAYPAVPTASLVSGAKNTSWTRSGETNITLSPEQTIKSDEVATANNINTAINNCYNDWVNKCYNNNALTYTMYTCHHNCHSNWSNSRGRR